ncbi:MAG: hypothetical protein K6F53_13020 [Lachnospiraceae bacterium]|nr:hypothetical protein [Lachnospiraceae bacterium]
MAGIKRSYGIRTVLLILLFLLLMSAAGCAKEALSGEPSSENRPSSDTGGPSGPAPFDPSSDPYLRESVLIAGASSSGEKAEDGNASGSGGAAPKNPCTELSVPTQVQWIDGLYFIVDCYHDQVIFHENTEDPLSEWSVMTSDISRGHTVASDGTVYLIDDTENHRVLIMEKRTGSDGAPFFVPTQEFTEVGVRPHYIVYVEEEDTFYVWSSMSGGMYLFRRDHSTNRMYLTELRSIDSLLGVYVRSFTVDGDGIWFVSGNQSILYADRKTFEIRKEYPVPESMAGMIQLTRIGEWFYITISTDASGDQSAATMIRTKDPEGLMNGDYEDVYDRFIGGGTPYYLTPINGRYYLTEHRIPGHSVWSFGIRNGEIEDVKAVY